MGRRLRTAIFDHCWVLIHDSLPPGSTEERVLDLRPWTEVTVRTSFRRRPRPKTEQAERWWRNHGSETCFSPGPVTIPSSVTTRPPNSLCVCVPEHSRRGWVESR